MRTGGYRILKDQQLFGTVDTVLIGGGSTPRAYAEAHGFSGKSFKPRLLTIEQVQTYLSCCERTVYKLRSEGLIDSVKIPGIGVRFRIEDLDAFIEEAFEIPQEETANV